MSRVSAPHIVCCACGRQTSHLAPLCDECEDTLAPCVGERFRDVLDERALDNQDNDQ